MHASTSVARPGSVRIALRETTKGSTILGREATHERKLEEAAHDGGLVPRFDGGPSRLPRYQPGLFCRFDRALHIGRLRLSRLSDSSERKRAVPLALHVDYWDRLGWKDRFASAAFTERQYEEMRRQHSAFVYTPQVFMQGRDFTQWRTVGDPAAVIAAINAHPARATIELAAETGRESANVNLRLQVPKRSDRAHAVIAVALVQSGLVSKVEAGENAGKRLAHDHVVRQWRAGPAKFDAAGEAQQQLVLALPTEAGPLSIVAFAEDAETGEVLQALALPLCPR